MYLGLSPNFTAPKPIISPAMMGFGAVKSWLLPAIGARLYPSCKAPTLALVFFQDFLKQRQQRMFQAVLNNCFSPVGCVFS
ncbi:MAG: hypothetical protein GY862_21965 [Gammaproteobacteria bacterium]|nr:hypothetical protein [Gammaproteobacteria bacterium]